MLSYEEVQQKNISEKTRNSRRVSNHNNKHLETIGPQLLNAHVHSDEAANEQYFNYAKTALQDIFCLACEINNASSGFHSPHDILNFISSQRIPIVVSHDGGS